jgi:hypothetical protein
MTSLCHSNCIQTTCHRHRSRGPATKNFSPTCQSYLSPTGLRNLSAEGFRAPNSVLIRGTLYPSLNQAAVALGVNANTIRRALERGTQDKVALTAAARRGHSTVYDGTAYKSSRAAFAQYRKDGGTRNLNGFIRGLT